MELGAGGIGPLRTTDDSSQLNHFIVADVLLVPVLQVVAYTIFTIPWMAICILLAAGGDIVVDQVGLTDDDGAIQVNYKSFE